MITVTMIVFIVNSWSTMPVRWCERFNIYS